MLLKKIRERFGIRPFRELKNEEGALVYLYQKAFYYIGIAKTELLKPFGLWNETAQLLTLFVVWFNYRPPIIMIISSYVGATTLLLVLGKILTSFGFAKKSNTVGNEQNPEIMLILKKLEEIETRLK